MPDALPAATLPVSGMVTGLEYASLHVAALCNGAYGKVQL